MNSVALLRLSPEIIEVLRKSKDGLKILRIKNFNEMKNYTMSTIEH